MACHMCVGLKDSFTLFSNLEKMRTPKALECAPQGTLAFGSYPQTVCSVTNYLKISVRRDEALPTFDRSSDSKGNARKTRPDQERFDGRLARLRKKGCGGIKDGKMR